MPKTKPKNIGEVLEEFDEKFEAFVNPKHDDYYLMNAIKQFILSSYKSLLEKLGEEIRKKKYYNIRDFDGLKDDGKSIEIYTRAYNQAIADVQQLIKLKRKYETNLKQKLEEVFRICEGKKRVADKSGDDNITYLKRRSYNQKRSEIKEAREGYFKG